MVNDNPTIKRGMHLSAKQPKPKDRHARSERRRSRRLPALRHSNTSKSITLVRIILVRNEWRVGKARHVLALGLKSGAQKSVERKTKFRFLPFKRFASLFSPLPKMAGPGHCGMIPWQNPQRQERPGDPFDFPFSRASARGALGPWRRGHPAAERGRSPPDPR